LLNEFKPEHFGMIAPTETKKIRIISATDTKNDEELLDLFEPL